MLNQKLLNYIKNKVWIQIFKLKTQVNSKRNKNNREQMIQKNQKKSHILMNSNYN